MPVKAKRNNEEFLHADPDEIREMLALLRANEYSNASIEFYLSWATEGRVLAFTAADIILDMRKMKET